ncbi:MAG: hypothetical protein RTU30_11600 [Candidatus Thorarchaeota archaeon]
MSSTRTVGLIMFLFVIITILPFGLVMFIFEMVGIMEYAGPFLWPIFTGTIIMIIVMMLVISGVVFLAKRAQFTSEQPSVSYTPEVQYSRDAYFAVPTRCPSCQEAIELDRVSWTGPQTMSCSNCFGTIHIRIREN